MLFNDQTLWKLDRTAQKALQLSTAFAVLGKKLGEAGTGWKYNVLANEVRILTENLLSIIRKRKFGDVESEHQEGEFNYEELTRMLELMALNTMVACILQTESPEAIIYAEDLREVVNDMKKFLNDGKAHQSAPVAPPVLKQYHPVSSATYSFLIYQIGGIKLVENVQFIVEIRSYSGARRHKMIDGNSITIHGRTFPFLDSYQTLGLQTQVSEEQQLIITVLVPHLSQETYLNFRVDSVDLYGFFQSKLGKTASLEKPPLSNDNVREVWLTEDDEPLIFLDWEKLL